MRYRRAQAGTDLRLWPNGQLKMDCDANGVVLADRVGWCLANFARHPDAVAAQLTEAHVAALRLYTTAAFVSLNPSLRDQDRFNSQRPHHFPITVKLIAEAAGQLKAVRSGTADAAQSRVLFRGLKNVAPPDQFMRDGGTELGMMSATFDANVAVRYSAAAHGVVLRFQTAGWEERGADIAFLSAFPAEAEVLYPPLTFIRPLRQQPESMDVDGTTFRVIDVTPRRA